MEQPEDQFQPPSMAEEDSSAAADFSNAEKPRRGRRRLATVYDAVAGKVFINRALRDETSEEEENTPEPAMIKYPSRRTPIAPDELLFRRKNAPERYAEHDVYNSHERDVPSGGRGVLPESDLLKAVHAYTSHFYGALERHRPRPSGCNVDERTMDETALLAFGILLEEAGREVLGRRGDLVFTEGADEHEDAGSSTDDVARDGGPGDVVGYREVDSWKTAARGPKRRKVVKQEDEDGKNDRVKPFSSFS